MAPLKTTGRIRQLEMKELFQVIQCRRQRGLGYSSGNLNGLKSLSKADYLVFLQDVCARSYGTVSLHSCACKPRKTKVSKCNRQTPRQKHFCNMNYWVTSQKI